MFTKLRLILGIFAVIGFLMLSAGGYFYLSGQAHEKNGIVATGQIIDLEISRSDNGATYCPVVRFTDGQNDFVFSSSFCSSEYENSAGDAIDVIYQPGNPGSAVIHSFSGMYGGAIILLCMGGIFALAGAIPLVVMYLKGKSGRRLLQEGMPVKAKITEVVLNSMISINGRSPYRIVAQTHDTTNNTVSLYYSENLAFNPEPYIDQEFVTVFLDKKKPEKYYMDISFLPKVK